MSDLVVLPADELEKWRRGRSVLNTYYSRSPEHQAWLAMISRCTDTRNKSFTTYGGRGIAVCERWRTPRHGFVAFFADLGARPSSKHSLDRINNDGNYEPGNCRWTTSGVQARNRSTNVWITVGDETLIVADWARRYDAVPAALRSSSGGAGSPLFCLGPPDGRTPLNTHQRSD